MEVGDAPKQSAKPKVDMLVRGKRLIKKAKADKYVDRTLGCRYELKYRITEAKAMAVTQFLKPYLHLDKYSRLNTGGMYPLVSLYLDSEDLRLCRETLTGKKNRFKLRIRCYSDDVSEPRFLEIKRRVSNVILKSRARISEDCVPIIFSGRALPEQTFKSDETTLKQFRLYVNSLHAQPKVLIRYTRMAFENDSNNRVRVTFDRELCHKTTSEPAVRLGGGGWQRHPMNHVILEIKFTDHYPAWLSRMVKCFDLKVQSTSKYATSLQHSSRLGFCGPLVSSLSG